MRTCDRCSARMAPGRPRVRVGGQQLWCQTCVKDVDAPSGRYRPGSDIDTAASKTASYERCPSCGGNQRYSGEHDQMPVLHGTTIWGDPESRLYMDETGVTGVPARAQEATDHPRWPRLKHEQFNFRGPRGGDRQVHSDEDHWVDDFTPLRHSLNALEPTMDRKMPRTAAERANPFPGEHLCPSCQGEDSEDCRMCAGKGVVRDSRREYEKKQASVGYCNLCGTTRELARDVRGQSVCVECQKGLTRQSSLRTVAHDSGDGQTIYHCPFCGSGQVLARSDRTIECEFCHTSFTVQVQPEYSAFPQTDANGQPIQVPGMPGQIDQPVGAQPDPNAMQDPNAQPTGQDINGDGVDDGFQAPASADNQPPWLKGGMLRTASGQVLSPADYVRHLAIKHADDRPAVLKQIRATRSAS